MKVNDYPYPIKSPQQKFVFISRKGGNLKTVVRSKEDSAEGIRCNSEDTEEEH